jgi:ABC-2 type transport system ATP-binding protein
MSGLDPPGRSLFRAVFKDLRDNGKSVFFSTHILEDVEALCSQVVVLARGERTYEGSVEALLAKGFEGTELEVGHVPDELRAQLEAMGCRIADSVSGSVQILVPADGDPREAQNRLADRGIYCDSVIRRRKSLESILYSGTGDS